MSLKFDRKSQNKHIINTLILLISKVIKGCIKLVKQKCWCRLLK